MPLESVGERGLRALLVGLSASGILAGIALALFPLVSVSLGGFHASVSLEGATIRFGGIILGGSSLERPRALLGALSGGFLGAQLLTALFSLYRRHTPLLVASYSGLLAGLLIVRNLMLLARSIEDSMRGVLGSLFSSGGAIIDLKPIIYIIIIISLLEVILSSIYWVGENETLEGVEINASIGLMLLLLVASLLAPRVVVSIPQVQPPAINAWLAKDGRLHVATDRGVIEELDVYIRRGDSYFLAYSGRPSSKSLIVNLSNILIKYNISNITLQAVIRYGGTSFYEQRTIPATPVEAPQKAVKAHVYITYSDSRLRIEPDNTACQFIKQIVLRWPAVNTTIVVYGVPPSCKASFKSLGLPVGVTIYYLGPNDRIMKTGTIIEGEGNYTLTVEVPGGG